MYPQDSNESCFLNASALLTRRQKNALFAARKSPKEEAKFCSVKAKFCSVKANAKMVTLLLCWCFSYPVPRLVDNLCSVSLCYVLPAFSWGCTQGTESHSDSSNCRGQRTMCGSSTSWSSHAAAMFYSVPDWEQWTLAHCYQEKEAKWEGVQCRKEWSWSLSVRNEPAYYTCTIHQCTADN